ncbi:MAG: PilZ domain-containing protein, partial [Clostridia bacterium]|nr:PilZ domain-containing protein [Deltaproteobacteria bacterium]
MKNHVLTRQHRRADLDVYVNKIVGDEPHMVRVRDISESGMFLYRLLEPETDASGYVGLEIKLPETEDVIWAVGEVVRDAVR